MLEWVRDLRVKTCRCYFCSGSMRGRILGIFLHSHILGSFFALIDQKHKSHASTPHIPDSLPLQFDQEYNVRVSYPDTRTNTHTRAHALETHSMKADFPQDPRTWEAAATQEREPVKALQIFKQAMQVCCVSRACVHHVSMRFGRAFEAFATEMYGASRTGQPERRSLYSGWCLLDSHPCPLSVMCV